MAHDHPGIRGYNWLSVDFPGGPRYDLGLLEFLFILPVIAWFCGWTAVQDRVVSTRSILTPHRTWD